ncbi:ORF_37 [Catopsilia pomona nucleopolyhedrovirus]|uniref:ORF_37 n=1 Tax=Catopsilia pomona nucleopolyhedrovirus TaxID=1850906 RepID=A0A172WZB0_9ABAC|nr:ORF_37 [Catopsilia pomona nucleopolyhedrovirus]ANF29685.1 ORF_37 [Catopsilia pomona nucleopolyhedrovirus]
MDNYSMHNFYNNNRQTLKPTTLHDGNIAKSAYEEIVFIRKIMCKETMPNKNDRKFNLPGYDKENKYK